MSTFERLWILLFKFRISFELDIVANIIFRFGIHPKCRLLYTKNSRNKNLLNMNFTSSIATHKIQPLNLLFHIINKLCLHVHVHVSMGHHKIDFSLFSCDAHLFKIIFNSYCVERRTSNVDVEWQFFIDDASNISLLHKRMP